MKSVETLATLTADGVLTAKVHLDIPPGDHRVVIVIDDRPILRHRLPINGFVADQASNEERVEEGDNPQPGQKEPLRFSAYEVGLISDDFTFRREDLYDDDI